MVHEGLNEVKLHITPCNIVQQGGKNIATFSRNAVLQRNVATVWQGLTRDEQCWTIGLNSTWCKLEPCVTSLKGLKSSLKNCVLFFIFTSNCNKFGHVCGNCRICKNVFYKVACLWIFMFLCCFRFFQSLRKRTVVKEKGIFRKLWRLQLVEYKVTFEFIYHTQEVQEHLICRLERECLAGQSSHPFASHSEVLYVD